MSAFFGLLAGLLLVEPAEAERLYARDFHGEFAQIGSCVRTTEHWAFTEREVIQAQTACQVTNVVLLSGNVVVSTRNCTKAGKAIADREYVLDLMSVDVIKARVDETSALLERCPSR